MQNNQGLCITLFRKGLKINILRKLTVHDESTQAIPYSLNFENHSHLPFILTPQKNFVSNGNSGILGGKKRTKAGYEKYIYQTLLGVDLKAP